MLRWIHTITSITTMRHYLALGLILLTACTSPPPTPPLVTPAPTPSTGIATTLVRSGIDFEHQDKATVTKTDGGWEVVATHFYPDNCGGAESRTVARFDLASKRWRETDTRTGGCFPVDEPLVDEGSFSIAVEGKVTTISANMDDTESRAKPWIRVRF